MQRFYILRAERAVVLRTLNGGEHRAAAAGDHRADALRVDRVSRGAFGGVEHAETAGRAAAGIDEPPSALHPRIDAVDRFGDLRADLPDRPGDLLILLIDETHHVERRQTVNVLRGGVALLGGELLHIDHFTHPPVS